MLGATISVLTALLLIIICYRHLERDRRSSPIQQLQNGYGYHIIDTDRTVKFTDTSSTPTLSSRTLLTRSPVDDSVTDVRTQDLTLTCPIVGTGYGSDSIRLSPRLTKKDNQPKRVLRFALDDEFLGENDIRIRRVSDQEDFNLAVRETEI